MQSSDGSVYDKVLCASKCERARVFFQVMFTVLAAERLGGPPCRFELFDSIGTCGLSTAC